MFSEVFAVCCLVSIVWGLAMAFGHRSSRKVYISLDGNIGSGKSTLLGLLQANCPRHVRVVAEPVTEWENLKDGDGDNLLQKFYSNPSQYASTFQMVALFTRVKNIDKALRESSMIISERSPFSDRGVFARMLLEDGDLSQLEYNAYNLMFDWFRTYLGYDFPPITIYINTSPSSCLERIHKRSRDGESNISLEYLERLHEQHLRYLSTVPTVIEVDGEQPVEDMFQSLLDKCAKRGLHLVL